MKLTGTIKSIGETKEFANNFRVRQLVLTTDDQYPQTLQLDFTKEKTYLLDEYNVGDSVSIDIYFNSIIGWRIESNTPIVKEVKEAVTNAQHNPDREVVQDLPF